jgi:hypothetical protein
MAPTASTTKTHRIKSLKRKLKLPWKRRIKPHNTKTKEMERIKKSSIITRKD